MLQNFLKIGGGAQAVVGLLGQFVPAVGSMLNSQEMGAATGGNVFNILSGAALSYLGLKGSDSGQRMGAQVIGGLNGVVGLLGAFGVNNLGGLQLTNGWGSVVVNLVVAGWGLFAGFTRSAEISTKKERSPMANVGIRICVVGSLIAILFIPCKVMGTNVGWHFILSDAGFGMESYRFIDPVVLLLELILINGIGFALFFIGNKQK